VLSTPRAAKLRELEPISLDGARSRFGDRISEEELLLRLTMPAEQVDAMVAAKTSDAASRPATAAAAAAAAATAAPASPGEGFAPVVTLLRELAARPEIQEFSLTSDEDSVVWRRGQ
jgi:oxaloacetate decarboxylase alpha subunit